MTVSEGEIGVNPQIRINEWDVYKFGVGCFTEGAKSHQTFNPCDALLVHLDHYCAGVSKPLKTCDHATKRHGRGILWMHEESCFWVILFLVLPEAFCELYQGPCVPVRIGTKISIDLL
jgi:hypothetical protein